MNAKRLTVIGIGQTMRGDDAAGIAAVHKWQQSFPDTSRQPGLTVQYSELPGLDLLNLLEGFDAAVIVDAVASQAAPGTLYRLGPDDLAAFASASRSAHGWGIAETLTLAEQTKAAGHLPAIRLVGITAQQMELGAALSTAVEQALPEASEAIEAEVQLLLASPGPTSGRADWAG